MTEKVLVRNNKTTQGFDRIFITIDALTGISTVVSDHFHLKK